MLSFANVDIVKFKELMGSAQEAYGVTKEEHGDFQAVSKGRFADTRPLFSNDLEETRPLNRRVEFLFIRG